jgi:hypothetical protein
MKRIGRYVSCLVLIVFVLVLILVATRGNAVSSGLDDVESVSDGDYSNNPEDEGSDRYTAILLLSSQLDSEYLSDYVEGKTLGAGKVKVDEVYSYGSFADIHAVGIDDLKRMKTSVEMADWIEYMSKWCYCYYGEGYSNMSLYLESEDVLNMIENGDCYFRFVSRCTGAVEKEWFVECSYENSLWYVNICVDSGSNLFFEDSDSNTRVSYICSYEDDMMLSLDVDGYGIGEIKVLDGVPMELGVSDVSDVSEGEVSK